jgi:hypothetical protein
MLSPEKSLTSQRRKKKLVHDSTCMNTESDVSLFSQVVPDSITPHFFCSPGDPSRIENSAVRLLQVLRNPAPNPALFTGACALKCTLLSPEFAGAAGPSARYLNLRLSSPDPHSLPIHRFGASESSTKAKRPQAGCGENFMAAHGSGPCTKDTHISPARHIVRRVILPRACAGPCSKKRIIFGGHFTRDREVHFTRRFLCSHSE